MSSVQPDPECVRRYTVPLLRAPPIQVVPYTSPCASRVTPLFRRLPAIRPWQR